MGINGYTSNKMLLEIYTDCAYIQPMTLFFSTNIMLIFRKETASYLSFENAHLMVLSLPLFSKFCDRFL